MNNQTENEIANKADATKAIPTKKVWVKWLLCWFCLSFIFVFCSNIFMHLFSCRRDHTDKNALTLREYKNCIIGEDGQYERIEDHTPIWLTYSVNDPSKEISKIVIDFGKPTSAYHWIELYYPDEDGNYPIKEARKERLVSGLTEHVIDIEPDKYQEIRLLFVQMEGTKKVYIENVYAGEVEKIMIYADKAQRYRIWLFCFILAFFLSFLLFSQKKFRMVWDSWCRKLKDFIIALYASVNIRKVLKVTAGGLLISGCLEGIAMFLYSHRFNGKETLVFFAIGIILLSFFAFREVYTQKMECASLFIFLILAFTFVYIIPTSLGVSWDDDTHYYRIISMARAFAGTITEADDLFDADVYTVVTDKERFQKAHSKQREYRYNERYRNGAVLKNIYAFNYKDVAYLPFVAGIWFSYGLGLSFCMTAFVAKLFQMLFIGLLIYASIKNLKSGQVLLLVFVMIPTVFLITISYGYDAWLIFLLIYAFSRYFRELQRKEKKLTFANFCKIFVPAFLALIPKIVYAPILFLMVYMPKSKWKEKKWRIAYHSCFVFAALCMVFVILYAASGKLQIGSGDSRANIAVNGDLQLQYIIHHFGDYCHTLLTYLRRNFSYDYAEEYLTNLSNIGSINMQHIAIPILFTAVVWDRSSVDNKTIPVLSKIAAFIMPVIIAAICATVMYLVYTAVGSDRIIGSQGRYLLPTIFPSLFMISRCKPYTNIHEKVIPIEYGKKILVELPIKEMVNKALIFFSVCFLSYNFCLYCILRG